MKPVSHSLLSLNEEFGICYGNYEEKLTLGDIGVSFLLPEKLLFGTLASSTFPTFKLTVILTLMMLMVVDKTELSEDGWVEYILMYL